MLIAIAMSFAMFTIISIVSLPPDDLFTAITTIVTCINCLLRPFRSLFGSDRSAMPVKGRAAMASVANALRPFAREFGKSFVRYPTPEKGRLHEATLDAAKLIAHKEVLLALLATGLERFNESVVQQACEQLFREFQHEWNLTDDEKHSWVTTISLRLRVMVSQVIQAKKKKGSKVPQWA
eukprot:4829778-Lingulodinium_polyedra.AAC.1